MRIFPLTFQVTCTKFPKFHQLSSVLSRRSLVSPPGGGHVPHLVNATGFLRKLHVLLNVKNSIKESFILCLNVDNLCLSLDIIMREGIMDKNLQVSLINIQMQTEKVCSI